MQTRTIRLTVNGKPYTAEVETRKLLSDFLREDLGLTGTHVGCEHGVCGACTILSNGQPVRSCLQFAVQADGATLMTVEGLGTPEQLHPLQEAFWAEHGLQCGFCTPGFLMTAHHLLQQNPNPSRAEIREALSGNLCRCTGYMGIVNAVERAAKTMTGAASTVRVVPLDGAPPLPIIEGPGEALAVLSPADGARERAFCHIRLEPGAATIALEHPQQEAVYYVAAGRGIIEDQSAGESYPVEEGHMFFLDAATRYRLIAGPDAGITFVGGPCPPDPELYRELTANQGGGAHGRSSV